MARLVHSTGGKKLALYARSLIEIKLGNKQIDEASKNLLSLQTKINTEKMGKPSFLMVVTGGEFAYTRDDGVLVVPIGCLKA